MDRDDNVNKARTRALVAIFPGVHLRRLQRLLGASFTTTRYHVHELLRDGEIVSEREKGYTRLYPSGIGDGERRVYASLQNKSARRVLRALMGSWLSKGELAGASRLSRSTVAKQLASLQLLGLIEVQLAPDGHPAYRVRDAEKVAPVLSALERSLLAAAADNFIDLWGDL